jgi:hypothetical protein
MLDQIIVSQALLGRGSGLRAGYTSGKILRKEWMLYQQPKVGDAVPNRTYGGPNYYGGISDHLPVYVVFKQKIQP